jgi:hypothetical protein
MPFVFLNGLRFSGRHDTLFEGVIMRRWKEEEGKYQAWISDLKEGATVFYLCPSPYGIKRARVIHLDFDKWTGVIRDEDGEKCFSLQTGCIAGTMNRIGSKEDLLKYRELP